MALKALCIGINDYPGTGSDLAGCVNDADDWRDFLTERGFEVTQLLNSQATKRAMLREISALIREASADDVLVITYSGHGSWIPDNPGGDETDHRDEVLCPYDVTENGPLSDDELYNIYSSLQEGVHAVFISDSCHSGAWLGTPSRRNINELAFFPRVAFLTNKDKCVRKP
jgi:uncharacterized caspase-like protein